MQDSVDTLVQIYNKRSDESPMLFLNNLDEYLSVISNDDFLSKALLLMQKYHQEESVNLARKSSNAHIDLDSIQDEIQETIDDKYQLYALRQLLKIQKDFQHIKQYKTQNDIPDITLTIPDKDEHLEYSSERKVSLRKIPQRIASQDLMLHFSNFHKAFMDLFSEIESKGGVFSKYFDYDTDKGILYFNGIEIKINERKKTTNANHLLSFLFINEPFEQHFYSEMEEEKVLLENKHWSSYHKACVDIQNKVLAKTQIPDFLDFNSGPKMYVRINPLYSALEQ